MVTSQVAHPAFSGGAWWRVFRIAAVARARDEHAEKRATEADQVAHGGAFCICIRSAGAQRNQLANTPQRATCGQPS